MRVQCIWCSSVDTTVKSDNYAFCNKCYRHFGYKETKSVFRVEQIKRYWMPQHVMLAIQLVAKENKIWALRLVQEMDPSLGLIEAKELVDAVEKEPKPNSFVDVYHR